VHWALRYCVFFAGSCVVLVLDEASELGCDALDPELLGCALELDELESLLLGAALAPPEAEPDLLGSLELPLLMPADELEEPGVEGLDEALPEGGVAALLDDEEPGVDDAPPVPPTEADPEVEPGALDGEDGLALLEVDEPGAEDLLPSPRSHAARPKASATATARVESFMGPPWGWDKETSNSQKNAAILAPGLSP
jgi:hypothetical protein